MASKSPTVEMPSLFDGVLDEKQLNESRIAVVKASFSEIVKSRWEDLFDGYDEMYAITYSSGIDFVANVVSRFQYAEIVFGHEGILDSDIATVMAVSKQAVETIAKHKSANRLAELMEQSKLSLFVARDSKSHEKIYCLKSKDEKYRVIVGSANLSATAFKGIQRENIVCFDQKKAYDYYKNLIDEYKEECADSVSYKVIGKVADDNDYLGTNPEEIPVLKTIEKKKTIILDPLSKSENEDVQFIADVTNVSKELKPIMPVLKKQGNNVIVKSATLSGITRKAKEAFIEKKERRKEFPKLHIDYDNQKLLFNEEEINLNPNMTSVARDCNNILNFFDSLSKFTNEWESAQENYFKFMNWYFASAFMAKLRLTAYNTGYSLNLFPVVGILYGASNGGKSTFAKLLTKLMTGKNIHPNQSDDFTATKIDLLRQSSEGVPIYIDDLAKTQYQNHNEKVIKTDNWGIKEGLINYPAIAISTNKLPSVTPDIYKRSITCRINVRISLTDGVGSSRKINEIIKNSTTAFYAEYVRRMLPIIADIEENMKRGSDENPDILKESSRVLVEMIKVSEGDKIPSYVRVLSYDNYFGTDEIGQEAKKKILSAWEAEPDSFKVYKRKNKLVYTFAENAYYDIKYLTDELPPNLNCQLSSRTLTMDYSDVVKFFDCKFKKRLFGL